MPERIELDNNLYADIFLPEKKENISIIYIHEPIPDKIDQAWSLIKSKNQAIIAITVPDWNRDMTPWPAKKVFNKEADFTGGADNYLQQLISTIIPTIEKKKGIIPLHRGIAGYSLGGLFALYTMFRTDMFDKVASISGSLWYNNWIEYITQNRLINPNTPIFLSIGDREKITHNERFASVEEKTLQTGRILKDQGAKIYMEINQGNHFTHMEERIAHALDWLAEIKPDNTGQKPILLSSLSSTGSNR